MSVQRIRLFNEYCMQWPQCYLVLKHCSYFSSRIAVFESGLVPGFLQHAVSEQARKYGWCLIKLTVYLKGQRHEIFDPRLFHQTILPSALIRFENRQNLIPGVNDTAGSDFFVRVPL
jgi:hypothetical protein